MTITEYRLRRSLRALTLHLGLRALERHIQALKGFNEERAHA